MIAEGADIIDIGAESTRPYGAQPVSADEELQRLQPILPEVVSLGIPVSIDSMKSAVVAWALDAGAAIANDVWGLQRDPRAWPRWWRSATCPSSSCTTATAPMPASTSCRILQPSLRARWRSPPRPAFRAEHIVLDPGIGFGKTPEQSMTALARLDELRAFGLPLLVGASRKRFISSVVAVGAASAARRLDRGASDRGQRRRADHPHP